MQEKVDRVTTKDEHFQDNPCHYTPNSQLFTHLNPTKVGKE